MNSVCVELGSYLSGGTRWRSGRASGSESKGPEFDRSVLIIG